MYGLTVKGNFGTEFDLNDNRKSMTMTLTGANMTPDLSDFEFQYQFLLL